MEKDHKNCNILIISPDRQYAALLGTMLDEWLSAHRTAYAYDYHSAAAQVRSQDYSAVVLDSGLGGADKLEVLQFFRAATSLKNFIVLAEDFQVKFCASAGPEIADFLEKKCLTSFQLYKSCIHAVKKNTALCKLRDARRKFGDIFRLSPLPMWIYDIETVNFFKVNDAAVRRYGYTKKEFRKMSLRDIRPQEDIPALYKAVESIKDSEQLSKSGMFRHRKKCGAIIHVELISNLMYIDGKKHRLVVVHDVTERAGYIEEIEKKNRQLLQIAHEQSHIVRAPLANMMGILQMMKDEELTASENAVLVESLFACGKEFDQSIRSIAMKSCDTIYRGA